MVDAALGTADALEWSDANRAGFYPLYAAWNNGLKVTATGGEDSISSLHRSKLLGSLRTYVYTGSQGLDMQAWFEAMKKGRAVVSSGPLLEFNMEGALPGDTVSLPAGGVRLHCGAGFAQSLTWKALRLSATARKSSELSFLAIRSAMIWKLSFRLSAAAGVISGLRARRATAFRWMLPTHRRLLIRSGFRSVMSPFEIPSPPATVCAGLTGFRN